MLRLSSLLLAVSLLLDSGGLLWQEKQRETLLPVLMYHEVKWENPGKDSVLPSEMESDLQYLACEGYTTVLMKDILAYVYTDAPLPEKPILLTFDDGYESNYRHLYPLLQKYGARAVISVIGKSADEFSLLPPEGGPYVHASWAQLLEMQASGLVELQNHSYDLHRNDASGCGCQRRWGEGDRSYEARICADLDRLQEELYAMTGAPATVFAYPYGCYDADLEGIIEELGFQATLTCDFGVNRLSADPACLRGMKRICRSHGVELKKLLDQALKLGAP